MPILPFEGVWPRIAEDVFIAESATIIGNVIIESGASIWYNAVLRGDTAPIHIGAGTNIQDNCTVHADSNAPCTIGADCTIGHNAVVHGCTIGDRVLIGISAVVLSHSRIGSETIIGAAALVGEHKEIPSGTLVLGVPAKVVRDLTEEERASISDSARRYQGYAAGHRHSRER
jgi:carbonic anhydrase/acetyltransferase-like protein (isoleucine patch superfamily)